LVPTVLTLFPQSKIYCNRLFFAISGGIDDIIDAAIGLSLTTIVVGVRAVVALGEQRASEQGTTILAIDIVISVDEDTTDNRVTHGFTISNSVHQTIGQVVTSLSSASKTTEGLVISRWLGVLGRALELIRVSFQVVAILISKAWVFATIRLAMSKVPSGMRFWLPRRQLRVVTAVGAQVELDSVEWRGNDAREGDSKSNKRQRETHGWMNENFD